MSSSSFAAELESQPLTLALESFAEQLLHKKAPAGGRATAISMAVQCKNNSPIYVNVGTHGFHDPTPIHKNSLFRIGSITKSFISVVILQLVQEKGLSLDDSTLIAKYFPEYPKWRHITLRQLLNMTSGIPANSTGLADDIFLQFSEQEYKNYMSPKKILGLEHELPLRFAPGTGFEYSNANTILLGQFIEKLTGQDIRHEVKQRIFKKLDLQHTYFPKDKIFMVPGIDQSAIVHGYSFYPQQGFKQYSFIPEGADSSRWTVSISNAAGAIVSTPADINTYIHALYNPGPLLNEAQIKDLTTLVSKISGSSLVLKKGVEELGYGMGIVGYYWPKIDHVIYLFNGSTEGYSFIYLYAPKNQLYLSYAVNVNPASQVAGFDNSIELFSKLYSLCK